jgi:hypothetical protein
MKTKETKMEEIKEFYHQDFLDTIMKESKTDLIHRLMNKDKKDRSKDWREVTSDDCEIVVKNAHKELTRIKISSGYCDDYLEYNRNDPFEIAEKIKALYNYEGIETTITFTDKLL